MINLFLNKSSFFLKNKICSNFIPLNINYTQLNMKSSVRRITVIKSLHCLPFLSLFLNNNCIQGNFAPFVFIDSLQSETFKIPFLRILLCSVEI